MPTGFPGYDAKIPKENGTVAEYLKTRNYDTYALGKWHLTPQSEMRTVVPKPLADRVGFFNFHLLRFSRW